MKWFGPSGDDLGISEGRIHVETQDNALGLVVERVREEEAGKYTCSAIIDDEEVTTSFNLIVRPGITFEGTNGVQYATEGTNFTLVCNAKADSSPILSFSFGNKSIEQGKKYVTANNTLVIRNVSRDDAGNYTCRAFVVTSMTSQTKTIVINVKVKYPPESKTPESEIIYSSVDSIVNITCEADGNPIPSFEWISDEDVIEESFTYRIFRTDSNTSILQVYVYNESVYGVYLCQSENKLGSIERKFILREGEKPRIPTVEILSNEPGSVLLKLEALPEGMLDVLGYKIEYRLLIQPWSEKVEEEFDVGSQYVLRNLDYNTKYVLRAAARNAAGYGNYSEDIEFTTKSLNPGTVRSFAICCQPTQLSTLLSIVLSLPLLSF
ncbi:limbic system-associated membrane protein-like isoform X2 [Tachypleus tridentatus]